MTGIPNTVNIQQDTPNTVTVNQEDQNLVTVQTIVNNVTVTTGSIATGATRRHVHTQGAVSSTWTITHALGGNPSVMVVDSSNTVVYGEIQYLSSTQVRILFSAAFSGFAYLT
jgi:hypothetical protein